MHIVNVNTPGGTYPIRIAPGRLDALDQSVPSDATSLVLVSSPVIHGLMGALVEQALAKTGKKTAQDIAARWRAA